MKRWLVPFALLLIAASTAAQAGFTLVSGTITGSDNFPYSHGTVQVQIIPSGQQVIVNGRIQPSNLSANLDATGSFSIVVADNSLLTPAGTKWRFTFCGFAALLPIGNANVCFTSPDTNVHGDTFDIGAVVNPAPPLTNIKTGGGTGCTLGGAADQQVIFDKSGACAGDPLLLWNYTTGVKQLFVGPALAGFDQNLIVTYGQPSTFITRLNCSTDPNCGGGTAGNGSQALNLIAQDTAQAVGQHIQSEVTSSGTGNAAWGLDINVFSNAGAGSGTIDLHGMNIQAIFDTPGTHAIRNIFGIEFIGPGLGTAVSYPAITTSAAIQFDDQNLGPVGATNSYAINIASQTTSGVHHAGINDSSGYSVFFGDLIVGHGSGCGATASANGGICIQNGGSFQIQPVAFASLPSCAAGTEGMQRAVNNSTTATWGATITGGGTNHVLAYCDGTNWTVAAM